LCLERAAGFLLSRPVFMATLTNIRRNLP
jgi:hypothetical protein